MYVLYWEQASGQTGITARCAAMRCRRGDHGKYQTAALSASPGVGQACSCHQHAPPNGLTPPPRPPPGIGRRLRFLRQLNSPPQHALEPEVGELERAIALRLLAAAALWRAPPQAV